MSIPFVPLKTAEINWDEDQFYFSNREKSRKFIAGNELLSRWQALPANIPCHFVICDTGFGSGLNFLETWSLWEKCAPASAHLHYISCEHQPVTRDDLLCFTSLWPELQEQSSALLTSYPVLTPGFHHLQFNDARVSLTLMLGEPLSCYRELLVCGDMTLEKKLRDYYVDAWFLPDIDSSMWSKELFMVLGLLSKSTTTLTAYSKKESGKQWLQEAGFSVSSLSNQDVLHAAFDEAFALNGVRHTPWHASLPQIKKSKQAIVLGAGLAGCYSAYALAKRGWSVTLIDKNNKPGCGASGNRQAVLYPHFSAYRSPLAEFMLSAFLFAARTYRYLLNNGSFGELVGILQLDYRQSERVDLERLALWFNNYPQLARLVDRQHASALAGVFLQTGGLFVPQSGWIDAHALCQYLIENPKINWVPNINVESLGYEANQWHLDNYHAEVLIIANAYNASQFEQTNHLPLKTVRGQMTIIASNEQSSPLRIPICADAHILPEREGTHTIGATYHPGVVDTHCYADDDACNLTKLTQLSMEPIWSNDVVDHWAGVRAATPDYLPLVGAVADAALFKQQYAGLATDSRRWISSPGAYHPGLYICAGFGSRGLTSIPLSAEWLAGTINNEPGILPRQLVQAISPARFLRKDITRNKK